MELSVVEKLKRTKITKISDEVIKISVKVIVHLFIADFGISKNMYFIL